VRLARALVGAVLCAPFLASACTGDGISGRPEPTPKPVPPQPGGGVTIGVVGEPATLDPYSPNASDLTRALVRPLYPSLFRLTPDGKAVPSLAASFQEVPNGASIELRRTQWSNGRPITAADVVASIERASPPSGFARVDSARATGSRRVLLEGNLLRWRAALATAAYVLPGGRAGTVSGGPFRIASRTPGLEIVYERNARFWGRPAYLERASVQFVEGTDMLLGLLEDRRLDAAAPPSTLNLGTRLRGLESDISFSRRLGWESIYLDFSDSALSRSQRVEVAESLARHRIETVLIGDEGRFSNSLHPGPGRGGVNGPWDGTLGAAESVTSTIRVAAAREDELMILVQEALYEQLTDAGLSVELLAIEGSELYGPFTRTETVDVVVRRAAGSPFSHGGRGAYRVFDALPVAEVSSWLAWLPRLRGPEPNPTFEGPLWNLEEWSLQPPSGG
jgi:hypothetical protein